MDLELCESDAENPWNIEKCTALKNHLALFFGATFRVYHFQARQWNHERINTGASIQVVLSSTGEAILTIETG